MILEYLKRRNNYFKNLRMLTESLRRPEELGLGKNEQQLKKTITQEGQSHAAERTWVEYDCCHCPVVITISPDTGSCYCHYGHRELDSKVIGATVIEKNSKLFVSLAPDSKFQTRGSAFDRVSSIQGKVVENSISDPRKIQVTLSNSVLLWLFITWHRNQKGERCDELVP